MRLSHQFLAFIVVTIWGVNFTFIKWGLESFPPIFFTAIRFFLLAFPLVFFVKPPTLNKYFFMYALGTFVTQFAFLFLSIWLGASPGLSALMLQFQVFFTIFFAYCFLGEDMSRNHLIGLGITILGLILVISNLGGDMPALGLLCILIAAAGWSVGNIASRNLGHESIMTLLVWGGLLAALSLSLISLIVEPAAWRWQTIQNASLKSWLSLGFVVYCATFIGYGIWTKLLQNNVAANVVPFALMIPVVSMLTSVMLSLESFVWWKVMAMILIICGLIISQRKVR